MADGRFDTPEQVIEGWIHVLHRTGDLAKIPAEIRKTIKATEIERIRDEKTGLAYAFRWYAYVYLKRRIGAGWHRFMPEGKPRASEDTGKDWAWQEQLCLWIVQFTFFLNMKARQLGTSHVWVFASVWMATFFEQQKIGHFSNNYINSQRNVVRARQMYSRFPAWLREEFPLVNPAKSGMEWANGSTMEPFAAGDDAGRSEGLTAAFVDEVGEIDKLEFVWPSLEACAENGGRIFAWGTAPQAGTSSLIHGWCVDATAGKQVGQIVQETPEGEVVAPVYFGINEMGFCFLPATLHAERNTHWFEVKRRQYKGNIAEFLRNYPIGSWEEAFIAAGSAYFDHEAMKAAVRVVREAFEERDRVGTLLWVNEEKHQVAFFEDPQGHVTIHASHEEWEDALKMRRPFVGGADCAGDKSSNRRSLDFHAASFVQSGVVPYDGELDLRGGVIPHRQLLTIHGQMDTDIYAQFLVRAGYFTGTSLLVIETNGVGTAVLKEVRRLRYPAIYARRVKPTSKLDKPTKEYGWFTTDTLKAVAYGETERQFREGWLEVRDYATLLEMADVRNLSGAKIGASEPKHDDRPDGLVLAVYNMPRARDFSPTDETFEQRPQDALEALFERLERKDERDWLGQEMQGVLGGGGY